MNHLVPATAAHRHHLVIGCVTTRGPRPVAKMGETLRDLRRPVIAGVTTRYPRRRVAMGEMIPEGGAAHPAPHPLVLGVLLMTRTVEHLFLRTAIRLRVVPMGVTCSPYETHRLISGIGKEIVDRRRRLFPPETGRGQGRDLRLYVWEEVRGEGVMGSGATRGKGNGVVVETIEKGKERWTENGRHLHPDERRGKGTGVMNVVDEEIDASPMTMPDKLPFTTVQ